MPSALRSRLDPQSRTGSLACGHALRINTRIERGAVMSSKASLAFLVLLLGAVSVPIATASAAGPSAAQAKKAQLAKAKKAQARKAQLAKQQQQQKEEAWYAKDRDRGLDIAEKYAPSHIKRVKQNNYVAKGDSVETGGGKKGWQHYMDKYYKR